MGEDVDASAISSDINRYILGLGNSTLVLALAGYRVTVLHDGGSETREIVRSLQMIPTEVPYTARFGSRGGVSYV